MPTVTTGVDYAFNTDALRLSQLLLGTLVTAGSSELSIDYDGARYSFYGAGVAYDASGRPVSGTLSELKVVSGNGALAFDITGITASAPDFALYLASGDDRGALGILLFGDVTFIGSGLGDTFKVLGTQNTYYGVSSVTVQGGGGDDTLMIGSSASGVHTLVLSGRRDDYTITNIKNTLYYRIQDNRPGSPDGTDTVSGFGPIRFADETLPFATTDGYAVRDGIINVLRTNPLTPAANQLLNQENVYLLGGRTVAQALADVALAADSTTSVATMTYQFFTHATPTAAGLDYLVSPTGGNPNNLNSSYYSQFSTANRYINFAANLGRAGAGAAAFQAAYGGLSLAAATSNAYAEIFGSTPTATKVNVLLNSIVPDGHGGSYARANYFAFYGGDGLNGIGTKAAMVGWLISQADSAHVGTLETANMAYLLDLAAGKINGSVDLVGVYHGTPYTGG